MNIKKIIFFSILNGLLFALPFLYDYLSFLIFFAFALLFCNQEKIQKNPHKILYLIINVLIWQSIILYWFHSSQESFWSVNLVILLSIIVLLFLLILFFLILLPRISKWRYGIFCMIWAGYELFWLYWDIPYPMFSLGVVFGNFPFLIQWYSITGIIGGSLWILSVNFFTLKLYKKEQVLILSVAILIPILISIFIFLEKKEEENSSINAIAVNNRLSEENGLDEVLTMLSQEIDENTDIIVCPEGILNLPLSSIPINRHFSKIKRMLLSQSPNAVIILGSNLYEFMNLDLDKPIVHNIAVQCDTSGFVTFRNKKILVPFGEIIPYEKYLGKIEAVKTAVKDPITYNPNYDQLFKYKDFNILPLICYELYFSNEIRAYLKDSSIGIISCISHEYSVPNKTYYTQFLRMTRIQSITFRIPVIKSTINGYSSLIDSKGNIISTRYNTNEVAKGSLAINQKKTIYTKYGYLSALMILAGLIPLLKVRRKEEIEKYSD